MFLYGSATRNLFKKITGWNYAHLLSHFPAFLGYLDETVIVSTILSNEIYSSRSTWVIVEINDNYYI